MKINDFRKNASPEEWEELASYLKTARNRQKALPKEGKWDFSYSAIAPNLEKRGLLARKRKQTTTVTAPELAKPTVTEPPVFTVKDIPDGIEKISRSVQIRKDIYERLKTLESIKKQYTHAAILNQLLDDALAFYGY